MRDSSRALNAASCSDGQALTPRPSFDFDEVYQRYAATVWRGARRLGAPPAVIEDIVQDVFVVVHRRLAEVSAGSSVRAWLYAILIRVVRQYRRASRRRQWATPGDLALDPELVGDQSTPNPRQAAERSEAIRTLYAVLSSLHEQRREVLVLSELEQMTAPEIATALDVNVNTVYWRLRAARREFERAVALHSAANRRRER